MIYLENSTDKKERILAPPIKRMALPVDYWANIIRTVDYKISEITAVSGFGSVEIKLKVWSGSVSDVRITDQVDFRLTKKQKREKERNKLTIK